MESPPLSPPPPEAGPSSHSSPPKSSPIKVGDNSSEIAEPTEVQSQRFAKQAEEAKQRWQNDMEKHAYEAPKAERPQDDWQVAYIWAFIVKFNQRDKIRKLECLEDFEQSLVEQVANRPDDILEGTLIRFLSNLKPAMRSLNCENIQQHLSNYITEHLLTSSEFTVWDRPWAPNEEARSSCCSSVPERNELGRLRYAGEPTNDRAEKNPLRQIEKRGGGLFELDWRERARLLRQMVDWQLTHSDLIRGIINKQNHLTVPKNVAIPANQEDVSVTPMGMDRSKNRIWAFDNSGRMYKSGNPFKRPCPVFALSSNKTEFQSQIDRWEEYGNSPRPTKSAKGKGKEEVQNKKLIKGMEDEKKLAEKAKEMVEAVEKEETRIIRARKKWADNQRTYHMNTEVRETRTRRSGRKVDYTYGDLDDIEGIDDYNEYGNAKRSSRRGQPAAVQIYNKPVIPGERKSARLTAKDNDDDEFEDYSHLMSHEPNGTNGDHDDDQDVTNEEMEGENGEDDGTISEDFDTREDDETTKNSDDSFHVENVTSGDLSKLTTPGDSPVDSGNGDIVTIDDMNGHGVSNGHQVNGRSAL